MTTAALDLHAHDAGTHATSLPVPSRKLAMWVFIASECMFFATLISTFVIYRDSHAKGPGPKDVFGVPLVTAGTAVLLFSSFFVVMALNGAQQGDRRCRLDESLHRVQADRRQMRHRYRMRQIAEPASDRLDGDMEIMHDQSRSDERDESRGDPVGDLFPEDQDRQ